jgi:superfamily I DNA and RNA helicase
MALDVVWGRIENQLAATALVDALKSMNINGTLYLGYPVLPQVESSTTVEALLVALDPGLVAFGFPKGDLDVDTLKLEQDGLAYAIEGNLQKHESLRRGRKLGVIVNTVSFFPTENQLTTTQEEGVQYLFAAPQNLADCLSACQKIPSDLFRPLCAAVQRVTNIKPVKRRANVQKNTSRGAVLKKIERKIANLDEWQRKAAIETPDGPQRVRGLAGSGKTVVLALKASYLHAQHPDWDIAVTFHTRSLSQQFKDLVERFTLEHAGDKPDWGKLRILHSWGSFSEPGIYSVISAALKIPPMDFGAAKAKYGRNRAFEGICAELLACADKTPPELFDAVLIDEAQDLPADFLRLVHSATRAPKRIVWAYDELQNLNELAMVPVEELFRGRVSIINTPNAAQQDIILPICYRNTPWALTLAHALGFGLYRETGLVQLFDEPDLWKDIGYDVESGSLQPTSDVTLRRRDDSFPGFFTELLSPEDAVKTGRFENSAEQYESIAEEIAKNISEDELDPDDILIILPCAYTARSEYQELARSLSRRDINSHLAGVSSQRDVFAIPGSVAVTGIYRAKGNEAPMVYVANSQFCAEGSQIISLRNTLFTAITRSRAWVRIYGVGKRMDSLLAEIGQVQENGFRLRFRIPTPPELSKIRLINRDRSRAEKDEERRLEKDIERISNLIRKKSMTPELSAKLQALRDQLVSLDPEEQE